MISFLSSSLSHIILTMGYSKFERQNFFFFQSYYQQEMSSWKSKTFIRFCNTLKIVRCLFTFRKRRRGVTKISLHLILGSKQSFDCQEKELVFLPCDFVPLLFSGNILTVETILLIRTFGHIFLESNEAKIKGEN